MQGKEQTNWNQLLHARIFPKILIVLIEGSSTIGLRHILKGHKYDLGLSDDLKKSA